MFLMYVSRVMGGLYREKYGFLMQKGKCMEIEYIRDWDGVFRVHGNSFRRD